MRKQLIYTSFWAIFIFGINSCTDRKEYPRELMYCFEYLDQNWNTEEIKTFKNISEGDTSPRNYHFGIGLHLRNYLINNHPYSDSIQSYFHRNGVEHYDDMSSIILSSYHKYLNNKEIELDEYYAEMKLYQREEHICYSRIDSLVQIYDSDYLLGDTLDILIPMRDDIHLIYADCIDWQFNDSNDFKIKGAIVHKKYSNDGLLYFEIKLVEQSKSDIAIYGKTNQIGDTLKIFTRTSWKLIHAN